MTHDHHAHQQSQHVDPVCGMTVDPAHAAGSTEYGGTTFYFCSPSCKKRFDADPEAFVAEKKPVAVAPPAGTAEWTCPMHPEIVRDAPGSCPICGMALEPRTITLDDENPELKDMSRRFWISTVLCLAVVVFTVMPQTGSVAVSS